MGMWDKDRLYGGPRLDKWAELCPTDEHGQPDAEHVERCAFILWGAEVMAELVPTQIGAARKTLLDVSPLSAPENRAKVGSLASAIAAKVSGEELDRETGELKKTGPGATAEDFPAVVVMLKVPSSWDTEATVLQFVRPYDPAEESGKPAARSKAAAEPAAAEA